MWCYSKVVFSDPSGLIQHLGNALATVIKGKPKRHKYIYTFKNSASLVDSLSLRSVTCHWAKLVGVHPVYVESSTKVTKFRMSMWGLCVCMGVFVGFVCFFNKCTVQSLDQYCFLCSLIARYWTGSVCEK